MASGLIISLSRVQAFACHTMCYQYADEQMPCLEVHPATIGRGFIVILQSVATVAECLSF